MEAGVKTQVAEVGARRWKLKREPGRLPSPTLQIAGRAKSPQCPSHNSAHTTVGASGLFKCYNRATSFRLQRERYDEPSTLADKCIIPSQHDAFAEAPPDLPPPSPAGTIDCEHVGSRESCAYDSTAGAGHAGPWGICRCHVRTFVSAIAQPSWNGSYKC